MPTMHAFFGCLEDNKTLLSLDILSKMITLMQY